MNRLLRGLLTIFSVFLASSTTKADLTLSLAAESADPSSLAVGQTVRFDVVLSGLPSGGALDYLAGTVTFDSSLLGSAFAITAGAIIPDPTGFVGAGFSGEADAFYDAVFFSVTNTPITANGVFFTFDVVTQRPGSGILTFDLTSLAATDGNNDPVLTGAGPDLPFTVTTAAVPEPSSFVIALTSLVICPSITIFRQRSRRSCDGR